MRVYRKEAFLNLPEGVIYSKGKRWYFSNLSVKGATYAETDDWAELTIPWVAADDSGEAFTRLAEMLDDGASYPMSMDYGRDGAFDAGDIFLVLEMDDLDALAEIVATARLREGGT